MKDEHTYGKKMARNGRTMVIYKGTFISIQTLIRNFSIEFQSESDSLESSDSSLSCWCTTVPGRYVKGTNYFSKFL